eukprot:COSAG04_NODE_5900_length_1461_cov_1.149046_2_plen_156_part_00
MSNTALGAAGADDLSGRGPGDGASTKAADLPPASELLPKLHLALKMAGHGNWPRLAAPVLLLPLIGCIAGAAYWALHLQGLNADFRDILCIWTQQQSLQMEADRPPALTKFLAAAAAAAADDETVGHIARRGVVAGAAAYLYLKMRDFPGGAGAR